MQSIRRFPSFERLSVVIATILLAYATVRFVDLPSREVVIQLPGLFLPLSFSVNTLLIVVLAALTASGTDWLLREHPNRGEQATYVHWLLPALTALVIAVPLNSLPLGLTWWIAFGLGGLLLLSALIAEYIVLDPQDLRQPPAAAGLSILSYALFLILAIGLQSSNPRLVFALPPVTVAAWLVSLRVMHLRTNRWLLPQAFAAALVAAQLAAALHYLPLPPVAHGLAVLAPVYALNQLNINLSDELSLPVALIEPAAVLTLLWLLALLLF